MLAVNFPLRKNAPTRTVLVFAHLGTVNIEGKDSYAVSTCKYSVFQAATVDVRASGVLVEISYDFFSTLEVQTLRIEWD